MFLTSTNEAISGRVSVIGEFIKIEGSNVILRIPKGTIEIVPKGFENYKTKYLLVTGSMEDGVLVEESVQRVEDDFDFELFSRVSKQLTKYSEVF